MRYLQRKLSENIINDRTFEIWKKASQENTNEYIKAQKEVLKIATEATTIINGKFNNKKEPTTYYVNTEDMSVCCVKEQNITTYYELSFERFYSKETNKDILVSLIKDMEQKEKEHNLKKDEVNKKKKETDGILDNLNKEKELKRTELQILDEKIKEVTSNLSVFTKEFEAEDTILEIIKRRICKSEMEA